ncbi:hypothetical protein D9619_000184 [Psilocybe cf. subviscida]|uniref:Uncharacterized protein n=1 Tax=Psilocybe cf. subviscida TaxID=2480587 RepID=A0A8H5BFP7_9AGAR|nr:hypothetical protein D9619_000184 [Psilocybe cf. subviscida]
MMDAEALITLSEPLLSPSLNPLQTLAFTFLSAWPFVNSSYAAPVNSAMNAEMSIPNAAHKEHLVVNSSWARPAGGTSSTPATKLFTVQSIESDMNLTVDKPSWPLSSYAPAKYEPMLVAGLDQSFEELRVNAAKALKEGKINEYAQFEASTIAAAEQVFANLRANITQAYEQAVQQSAVIQSAPAPTAPATSAFGTPASGSAFPSTSSAFGTTSVFGNNAKPATSVFGTTAPATSAFGTAAPATSVFGTPAPATSAFGTAAPATSVFGTTAPATSAFGAPAATSVFGSTTTAAPAFGKPAFGQPAFGQTSTPAAPATGAFGQPLNNTATQSAFGTPAAAPATSAFGQPAFGQSSLIKPASGAFSAFSGGGASPFAAAAAAANNPTPAGTTTGTGGGAFSAFSGQPSVFGLGAAGNTTTQNVFGQPAFGQPSAPAAAAAPAASVFGAPAPAVSAFGAPVQATSVFGQPQPQPAQTTSVFGQPAAQPAAAPTSVFGNTGWGSGGGLTVNAAAAPSRVQSATMEMNPSTSSGSGMKTAVSATPAAGKTQELDFTTMKNAGVKPGVNPYDSMLPPNYAEMLPQSVQEAFKAPSFEWGNVPDWVPPLSVR